MTNQTHKTLPGGSIDYAHYLNRGREIRSRSFLNALGALFALFAKGPQSKVDPVTTRNRAGHLARRTRGAGRRMQKRPLNIGRAMGADL